MTNVKSNNLVSGLTAGTVATIPMTLAMVYLFRKLNGASKASMTSKVVVPNSLPPRKITEEVLDKTGAESIVPTSAKLPLTLLSHFGYGAVAAVPYAFMTSKRNTSIISRGAVYGLMVWGGSYLGLLPSLNFRTNAYKMNNRKNISMIAAHIVWGISVAAADKLMKSAANKQK